jgi:GT2 family glycosyltransferase
VGLRAALATDAELFWLLNNDTVCPPDTLRKLVRTAEANPAAGLVGSVLYYAHDPARVQAWGGGRVIPALGYTRHFYAPHPMNKDCFVTFASALARRAMLEQVGLLYEGFFMYFDDSDLALRMQRTSWKIAMASDTAILHKEGGSVKKGENPFMTQVVTVSGLRFIRRNSRLALLGMPVFVALRVANRVCKGQWRGAAAVLRGGLQFFREPMLP